MEVFEIAELLAGIGKSDIELNDMSDTRKPCDALAVFGTAGGCWLDVDRYGLFCSVVEPGFFGTGILEFIGALLRGNKLSPVSADVV